MTQPEPLVYPEPEPMPAQPPKEKKNWIKPLAMGTLNWLVIPGLIVLFLHLFVFQAFHVIGTSMVPTLHDTDYLIVSKVGASTAQLSRLFKKDAPYIPKHEQVIVFRYPQDPSLVFVKRVIGVPGDRVVVHGGKVTVYTKEKPKGYNPDVGTVRAETPTLEEVDEVVPPGSVFVLGDNRTPNGSFDSREWGMLPYKYIIGDAILRLIPINKITFY
jgi:signal peptidase I